MDKPRFIAINLLIAAAAAVTFVTPSDAFQSKVQPKNANPPKATQSKATAQKASAPKPGDVKINPTDKQRYVWIPPGKFLSGCSAGDKECFEDETPTRQITLTKGFWLGETEVTQESYDNVMEGDPSQFRDPKLPVDSISWDFADFYCRQIGGRLPSEAEWEWAARGGSTSARYGKLDDIAWYWDNAKFTTHPPKGKKPNAFGLYDMLGNVVEWTHTWYTVQHSQENVDPVGPSTAEYKSLRGGGWWDDSPLVRVSYRRRFETSDEDYNIGFRCVSP